MLQVLFHAWERRLASVTTNRVVRPFEWGLDWIPSNGSADRPASAQLSEWVDRVMTDTDAFFTSPPITDYTLGPASPDGDRLLTFPSAFETPHETNNTVYARLFPPRGQRYGTDRRAAARVLPQWKSDAGAPVAASA